MSNKPDAIILGAGIAGMAAALDLAGAGLRVEIIETRKKLGGRASSFIDPRTGETLDNCQHVALGCCTEYIDLLERLGTAHTLRFSSEQWWTEAKPDGSAQTSVLRLGALPPPLHAFPSFAAAKFLSIAEKTAIARALATARFTDRTKWLGRPFSDFLRSTGQPDGAINKFWQPVIISACNLPVQRASAEAALQVFQEGMLDSAAAGRIGVPGVPLGDLYTRFDDIIQSAGGTIRYGASVRALSETSATLATGEEITAPILIAALPFERTAAIATSDLRANDNRIAPLDNLTHSPILGVHLTFDRPVLHTPHTVLVDRPTQWLFRKSDDGSRIHAVISAADEWMPLTEKQIARKVLLDIHACIPEARQARLIRARSVKEKRATFAADSASDQHRPPVDSPTSSLILAGDYTKTGWPATMEGATRSGRAAASVCLQRLGARTERRQA